MKRLIAVMTAMGLTLMAAALMADTRCDRRTCEEVKAEIREIEARMRLGYSHAQGQRYDERLRQLRECRYRLCRQATAGIARYLPLHYLNDGGRAWPVDWRPASWLSGEVASCIESLRAKTG